MLKRTLLKTLTRQIFIQSQETPNPNFQKFLPSGKTVMETGTYDFTTASQALKSPLADKIFQIPGIQKIFFGSTYISIGKKEEQSWEDLKPQIFEAIEDFYNSEKPLFSEKVNFSTKNEIGENDSETIQLIKEIIETRIRPVLQEDGGDVEFRKFDEEHGVVILELQGSCTGCPSSEVTLKGGIERMLLHYVAEVKAVHAFDQDADEVEIVSSFFFLLDFWVLGFFGFFLDFEFYFYLFFFDFIIFFFFSFNVFQKNI